MGDFGWYDTDHDGSLDFAEMDRWQLDNGGYPGQFENDRSAYDDDDDDGGKGKKKSSRKKHGFIWDDDDNDGDDY